MNILAAFDKFRGTLSAPEACRAACFGAVGHSCRAQPIADGGEGTLDAFGGPNRSTTVTGPLGDPVEAWWRLAEGVAVIEMAQASGLALVDGEKDPLGATTKGTGELIRTAIEEGAETVVVGVGGSATTDGGWGAVEALGRMPFVVRVRVACDVETRFIEAARTFGPQKGADPENVASLIERLVRLAERYRREFGVDVTNLAGSGAAGGLAGGLSALGAVLEPGFDLVAEHLRLADLIQSSDMIFTGEGTFDDTSLTGKAVGGVLALSDRYGVPAIVIAGRIESGQRSSESRVSLTERFGLSAALDNTAECLTTVVAELLELGR